MNRPLIVLQSLIGWASLAGHDWWAAHQTVLGEAINRRDRDIARRDAEIRARDRKLEQLARRDSILAVRDGEKSAALAAATAG
jgi:hypothetical protein